MLPLDDQVKTVLPRTHRVHLDLSWTKLGSSVFVTLAPLVAEGAAREPRAGSPPGRPENVTVKRNSPSSVVITWLANTDDSTRYEISYKPVKARYKVVTEVDARQRSVVLEKLLPTALYQVQITAINESGRGNQSQTVIFDTSQPFVNGTSRLPSPAVVSGTLHARGEEIGIVVLVLLLWAFVIILFFNKWGKIRMLEPYQPQYKQSHVATCQHLGSRITLDGMQVSVSALFERERLLSVAHVHRPLRPRQNSVFVRGNVYATLSTHNFSRKAKSAEDIQSMIFKSAENIASTEM